MAADGKQNQLARAMETGCGERHLLVKYCQRLKPEIHKSSSEKHISFCHQPVLSMSGNHRLPNKKKLALEWNARVLVSASMLFYFTRVMSSLFCSSPPQIPKKGRHGFSAIVDFFISDCCCWFCLHIMHVLEQIKWRRWKYRSTVLCTIRLWLPINAFELSEGETKGMPHTATYSLTHFGASNASIRLGPLLYYQFSQTMPETST